MKSLVVIACGSRHWTDRELIALELNKVVTQNPDFFIIIVEGGAKGADRLAGQWAAKARQRGVGWLRISAEWAVHHPDWCFGGWCAARRFCAGAGPRRNQSMLDYALGADAQYVLAFKDDFDLSSGRGGTEDMVRRAKQAGVHGKVVRHSRERPPQMATHGEPKV